MSIQIKQELMTYQIWEARGSPRTDNRIVYLETWCNKPLLLRVPCQPYAHARAKRKTASAVKWEYVIAYQAEKSSFPWKMSMAQYSSSNPNSYILAVNEFQGSLSTQRNRKPKSIPWLAHMKKQKFSPLVSDLLPWQLGGEHFSLPLHACIAWWHHRA